MRSDAVSLDMSILLTVPAADRNLRHAQLASHFSSGAWALLLTLVPGFDGSGLECRQSRRPPLLTLHGEFARGRRPSHP